MIIVMGEKELEGEYERQSGDNSFKGLLVKSRREMATRGKQADLRKELLK